MVACLIYTVVLTMKIIQWVLIAFSVIESCDETGSLASVTSVDVLYCTVSFIKYKAIEQCIDYLTAWSAYMYIKCTTCTCTVYTYISMLTHRYWVWFKDSLIDVLYGTAVEAPFSKLC